MKLLLIMTFIPLFASAMEMMHCSEVCQKLLFELERKLSDSSTDEEYLYKTMMYECSQKVSNPDRWFEWCPISCHSFVSTVLGDKQLIGFLNATEPDLKTIFKIIRYCGNYDYGAVDGDDYKKE
ncbi:unnamed protein product [Cylicocyclus nassatus]|uniref:Saposin B-type domain-containing protein n=1 Tax=Cylicocyclus nassatus TaxID=53992 RepID=A0AA36DSY9_CYLNA|nr:unnamed protein product [Cylicocyclus nassatus]